VWHRPLWEYAERSGRSAVKYDAVEAIVIRAGIPVVLPIVVPKVNANTGRYRTDHRDEPFHIGGRPF
jgi:hypothetical protein